jgi:Holliday junction DNA helicase RuvB
MIEEDKNVERIVVPEVASEAEVVDEEGLRPHQLDDYVGQEKLREQLSISIEAAKGRGEPLEHVLFYGPPGLGKTTLAMIMAREMKVNLRITSGPAIEKQGDLAAILTNLKEGDVLFIDEIHRMRTSIEEILYSAMEDFALDIIIGKGPSARTMRIDLPKFTVIGATTKAGMVSAPLRDRFGSVMKLEFYSDDNLKLIVARSAGILGVDFEDAGVSEIAVRSRKTPRIANRLLKRVRDIAVVKYKGVISEEVAKEALNFLGVDPMGLDDADRDYLDALINKFEGGPVGVETMAAVLSEEGDTLEDVVEPFLLQIGFIQRTSRGRVITDMGKKYF